MSGDLVMLAGSGRSGTTWVAEVLNHDHRFRDLFEPFWGHKVEACRGFAARHYLRPGDPDPARHAVAADILAGRIRNDWIDQFDRAPDSPHRLVKEIRANLMLAWLQAHFPEMRIVLLLRHPGAVAASRLRLGWGTALDEMLAQPDLVDDHLGAILAQGRPGADPLERQLWFWCIENLVPLRQFSPGSIHVACYEDLRRDPEAGFRRIFDFLGLAWSEAVLDRVGRPSRMTVATDAAPATRDPLARWRDACTPDDLDRLDALLARFRLDAIYTREVMPHCDDPLARFE